MPFDPHPIGAWSLLTNAPGTAGTSTLVTPGTGGRFAASAPATLRAVGTILPLEIVRVTTVSGDTLTLTRAQEGTTALNATVGWEIFQGPTAKTFTDIQVNATQYNVRSYGAKGDDSNADDVGIQLALNAALAAGGGDVYLTKGTYRLYNTLTMLRAHNVRVLSDTREGSVNATKLVWYGTANVAGSGLPTAGSTMLVMDKCRECLIKDLSFLPSEVFGIGIDNTTYSPNDYTNTNNTFRGLVFQTLIDTSIGVRLGYQTPGNSDREVFDQCIFNGNGAGHGYGIKIEDSQVKELSLHDCLFNFIKYGIYAEFASFSTYDCNYEHVAGSNIYIVSGGDHVVEVGTMSEGAPMHLFSTGGNSAYPYVIVGGRHALDYYSTVLHDITTPFNYIQVSTRGGLTLLGVGFGDSLPFPGFRIACGFASWGGQFSATGCVFPNPQILNASSSYGCSYSLNNNQCASAAKQGYSVTLPDSKGSTLIGTTGRELALAYGGIVGGVTNIGLRLNGGGLQVKNLGAPTLYSVVPTGGVGTTYSYYVVAVDVAGNKSLASATVTTNVGPTTLDGTHYNTISWYHAPGGFTYDVIRSVGGPSQGSIALGLCDEYLIDNGLAASAYTPITRSASADSSVNGLWTTNSRAAQIRSVAGNDTATLDDNYLVCSTAMTETLPSAPPDGFELTVKRVDATNATTIARGGTDVIELAGVTATSRSLGSNGATLFLKYKASTLTWYTQTQGTVT